MTLYPDASILITANLPEVMSGPAQNVLSGADQLVASEWLLTEIASALGIKERARQIGGRTRADALTACRELIGDSATMLPISGLDCRLATELIERSDLCGGDALHLAIASRAGATL